MKDCFPAPAHPACLHLCLQYWNIPAPDDINARLDYLEANGYEAVEFATGDWLLSNADAFAKALEGRSLAVATACGFSDFSYADAAKRDAEVEKFLPQIDILGGLHSAGLIVCPARAKPELPFPELRRDFVENTGRRLAERAAAAGTAIVLEPLRREETPFLRQVADAAMMAQDIGPGATAMGDFWHMAREETSDYGAFCSAGPLLRHVHIASLLTRRVPGCDGAADDYVDGFRALKRLGYPGAVSFEGGFPEGCDSDADRHALLVRMSALLREQWAMAD